MVEMTYNEAGVHHIPGEVRQLKKYSDEIHEPGVLYVNRYGDDLEFATLDGGLLARSVFLSHDYGYRLQVSSAMRYLKIIVTKRARDGTICTGHPTLEIAVYEWRKRHETK